MGRREVKGGRRDERSVTRGFPGLAFHLKETQASQRPQGLQGEAGALGLP